MEVIENNPDLGGCLHMFQTEVFNNKDAADKVAEMTYLLMSADILKGILLPLCVYM